MILIIYCHPSKTSHSFKILERVTGVLEKGKCEVLDLYAMKFDAYFKDIEYTRIRGKIRETEPDVKALQEKIIAADTLIFIYPTWWYGMPARLKGFLDRVFSSGFAYKFFYVNHFLLFGANILSFIPGIRYLMQTFCVTPLLKGKKAIIFRTYGGPKSGKRIFGNTVTALENVVLRFCGITKITLHELFDVDKEVFTESYEEAYLKKIGDICKSV